MKKQVALGGLLAIALGLTLVSIAAAQTTATAAPSTVSGSWMGDFGGSYKSWDVTLPANTDVTLTYAFWPCNNTGAYDLEVWSAEGMMGSGTQAGACSKELTWNTGAGGPATIRLSNYFGSSPSNWSLTSTGMALADGMAPAMMSEKTMAPAAMMAPAMMATTETMAADTAMMAPDKGMMADDKSMMADHAMSPAMAPAMAPASGMAGTLFGDGSGAIATYDMPVMEGKTYSLTMAGGMDVGGNWPGVGFNVWGPVGLVASSHSAFGMAHSTTFTAPSTGPYVIQVYNYHPGRTLFYAFEPVATN